MSNLLFILRPFLYLTVRHESKVPQLINWLAPVALTLILSYFYYEYNLLLNIFGDQGLFGKILGFMQSLAGFYIAALAAVAALNNPNMDELMPGKPPVMNVVYNNGFEEVELTRRRYMCSMFSYLTATCLVLCLTLIVSTSFGDFLKSIFDQSILIFLKIFVFGFVIFFFTQMIVVTFWGLYYLGEKVHTPN